MYFNKENIKGDIILKLFICQGKELLHNAVNRNNVGRCCEAVSVQKLQGVVYS